MSLRGIAILGRGVRGPVILKYFGQLAWSLAALTLVPAAVGVALGEPALAWRFAAAAAVAAAVAAGLGRLPAPADIQTNEALAITALIFLAGSALLAWPFTAAGLPADDAVFEAVSGITTTGLSTLPSVEGHSATFLFARAWAQWYGGLAITVLALAFVVDPGGAAKRFAGGGGEYEDVLGGTRARARRVLVVYLLLTAVTFVALVAFGAGVFDALVHTLAAVSTGGFSSHDASIAGLGGFPIQAAVTLLASAGAISFMLYYHAWRTGWRAFLRDRELQCLWVAGVLGTVLLVSTLHWAGGRPLGEALHHAPLLALSAQSTTGFASLPVGGLDPASKVLLIVAMFVGGDTGSTAGGLKMLRALVLLRLLQLFLARTRLPHHAVTEVRLASRPVSERDIEAAVGLFVLYLFTVILSWLPFLWAGHAPLDSLFDVVSALGTVGLSTGVTAASLAPGLKALLAIDMLMGRLEIVALVVLLSPGTWRRRKAE